jgi:hypothetical protein
MFEWRLREKNRQHVVSREGSVAAEAMQCWGRFPGTPFLRQAEIPRARAPSFLGAHKTLRRVDEV